MLHRCTRAVLVPWVVVCAIAQIMDACSGFRLGVVEGRSRAGWVALCHHTEDRSEADWRVLAAYGGERVVVREGVGAVCCVQLRSRVREEAEREWSEAGYRTASVRVGASEVAVRVRFRPCMSGGFPVNWESILLRAIE